jgi:adenine-specific DNA-methyltransferase
MDKIKELGQVMTPSAIVEHMIGDVLNLTEEEIQNFTFLDNSCGDGAFVKGLLKYGVPKEHIFVCDIDQEILLKIKELLPESNIRCGSFFLQKDWEGTFDVVIGNPPFVRIHNILPEIKKQIKDFQFCFGMYDLYYAFYEYGLKMLKSNGKLLYISPTGFIRNTSGEKMRKYIQENHLLKYYEDFNNSQQFSGYSTYTGIFLLSRVGKEVEVPWGKARQKVGLPFSSLQNGLATLADGIFIKDSFPAEFERELISPILKASTGEFKEIICPPKTEEELKLYPNVYNYLLSHKEKLEGRSITGNTQWFEFGRSQGIKNIHNKKIAIGTTMPFDGLKLYILDESTYVYSGLYATADDIDKLYDALNEPELIDYLIENGKPMRGDYVQIGSTLLKNY